ncbi:unnamed protein product, partial [Arctogadus glacialis]
AGPCISDGASSACYHGAERLPPSQHAASLRPRARSLLRSEWLMTSGKWTRCPPSGQRVEGCPDGTDGRTDRPGLTAYQQWQVPTTGPTVGLLPKPNVPTSTVLVQTMTVNGAECVQNLSQSAVST